MKRTILKLEIVLETGEMSDGAPYPLAPCYRMDYHDDDRMLVELHLNRIAHALLEDGSASHPIAYMERVR